jgi:hypothetical protein
LSPRTAPRVWGTNPATRLRLRAALTEGRPFQLAAPVCQGVNHGGSMGPAPGASGNDKSDTDRTDKSGKGLVHSGVTSLRFIRRNVGAPGFPALDR